MTPRIAVIGAGLVGRRHCEILAAEGMLAAIADPSDAAIEVAAGLGAPRAVDAADLLDRFAIDAAVIATPNQRHEADGMACIDARVPVLIEKPLAVDAAAAERLVEAATAARTPLLVGHHRRYNPIVIAARDAIEAGRLGRIVAAQATCWLRKPDPYFETEWRRAPGAGPVLINVIHDVELLIHLCGDVVEVLATESNAIRGFAVEDTAAAILRFRSGALGVLTVSDAATAPWSWELTAGENPAYPRTGAFAYAIAGTEGSLSIPDLGMWRNPGSTGWTEPIRREPLKVKPEDPLRRQLLHFAAVARGDEAPLVTGADGLMAMRVVDAMKAAAQTGRAVPVAPRPSYA